ncbi:syndecan-4 isoform X2 [Cynoglossus semilaevis]|uniref:Syndecan n=1 Tax=Cynoglossus semilaevis TaxID=244447 RepID=A0A3P8V3Y8_CYNSE|nr:syndecan-4-like isoform X2 [Cynoglossus semilaevis]
MLLHLCLILFLSASVFSESVRETETWMPMKTTQAVAMDEHHVRLESSGDFDFIDERYDDVDDEDDDEDDYYDEDEYEEFSGSGEGETIEVPKRPSPPPMQPDIIDNKIPEVRLPTRPTVNEIEIVQNSNEIPLLRKESSEEFPANVLMAHASDDSIFNKTEVLAALIAGCAVGLMFAVLLILLLIYRMKKKDEGSYDLGKKPIYKKAPTTEIYA